ncbi:MAG: hypothetical protein E7050_01740 [Lentisphaerae bacterium]|nr:hypothetical protein [Lentisphaerota bacterium]
MKSKSLLLIDAYSQIFRSFYAIRLLTNSRGEPVNAAFVFTKLLLQLEKNHASEYGAMLFDCGKVAFRLELNPEYKANRPPMPDALKSQIPLIRRIAEAFGWELIQCEGYEADDLIGGFAVKYQDMPVKIVSSDKDLSQLINSHVSMLIPGGTSVGGFEHRGVDEVLKKFGVAPEDMVDYLALLGDASDNIPGIPGVGPKSAVEIIKTFGSADKWLNDPACIDPEHKLGKKLLPHLDVVRRNRELIRLRTDLPETVDKDLPPVKKDPDWQLIAEICQDNQFKSILKELPSSPSVETSVESAEDFGELFAFASESLKHEKKSAKVEKNEPEEIQGELF